MFIEPNFGGKHIGKKNETGWIEVVCGSMFSGKTEELIRRLNRAKIANLNVEIFKPATDIRYHESNVVSHDKKEIRSTPVQFANDILLLAADCDLVGIDEAQFFDHEIVDVSIKLANNGKRVIVAGLDMDFLARPFQPMNDLMAVAEFVTKTHAICMNCGSIASYTYRLDDSDQQVVLGEKDMYEARCRRCYNLGIEAKKGN
ncbi:MAG: thymidine kinase [Cyclobacteriaceae bacterium]|nr:thymidine kinase [Cyclobacteriaceae bacterium]MCK5369515.1 thymidine kinase [Cyclobacteriaceae bacterium]MCK5702882.1 thymidine kinase [Cyclobacteriaceae bacterium]